jgi:type 2 lantibiotic biosynthesis protein LanM
MNERLPHSGPHQETDSLLEPQERERVLAILARAAPPKERASGAFFAALPGDDQENIARRAAAWVEAAAGGDLAHFQRILAAGKGSWSDFLLGLRDVVVRDPARLPDWGAAIVEFVECQPRSAAKAAGDTPLHAVYRGYKLAGYRLLRPILDASSVAVSPEATEQMASQLAQRIANATARALDFELRIHTMIGSWLGLDAAPAPVDLDLDLAPDLAPDLDPDLDLDLEGWLVRLEQLPGLAYVIGVTCARFREVISELLNRLEADWHLLRNELWAGDDPAMLCGYSGDAGDPHDGGRSVAILQFEGGWRVVYKTKDLRVAAALMDLTRLLNRSLPVDLAVRTILCRGAYAWEEHVEAGPCQDASQVERYYTRMGMILRFLQLVEGRDFWLDNVLACGEYPVLVDLETVLQPRRRAPDSLSPAEQEIWQTLADSVVPTAAVAALVRIGGGAPAEDFGALTAWRDLVTPSRHALDALRAAGPTLAADEGEHIVLSAPPHAPFLDGVAAPSPDHLAPLLSGYRAMNTCLRQSRAALTAAGGPLDALASVPVRYIHRDTWSCYAIIQASLSPEALAGGVAREIVLARVLRDARDEAALEDTVLVLQSEIDAFRGLDVPLFFSVPSRRSAWIQGGHELSGYFEGTAFERLLARVADPSFDVSEQQDIVLSCLETGYHGSRDPALPPPPTFSFSYSSEVRWLEQATSIGDLIMSFARGPEEELSWLGLVYDPADDLLSLGPLRPDLLTGTGGLAVLFADLFALTGQARFRTAALGALGGCRRAVAETLDLVNRGTMDGLGPFPCGAFVGAGAQIYALRRCAVALEQEALGRLAASAASALPVAALRRIGAPDVISGLPGLLLAITAPAAGGYSPPTSVIRALREEVIERRSAGAPRTRSLYPRTTRFLQGIPGASEGAALALHRVAELDPELDRGAASSLERGATCGAVIAQLACAREGSVAAASDYLERLPELPSTWALLDGIEVAIAAHRATGRDPFLATAAGLARSLTARHEASGSWLPDRLSADRHDLSIVRGLAAIGHALLALANPSRVLSVRVVA